MSLLSKLKKISKEEHDKKEYLEKKMEEEEAAENGGGIPVYKIFEYIDCVTYKKIPWEELGPVNQKTFSNIFMINKFLSNIPEFSMFLSDIQKMQNQLSPEMFYRYLYHFLPKEGFGGKYIKEKPGINIDKDVLEVFVIHFEEKEENVKKYFKMMSQKDKIGLLKRYGWNDEKIEKKINKNA